MSLENCPIYSAPCLQETCAAYSSSARERFWDKKLGKYIPYDGLDYYRQLSPDELAARFVRRVTVVKECRQLKVILEINKEIEDSNLPILPVM